MVIQVGTCAWCLCDERARVYRSRFRAMGQSDRSSPILVSTPSGGLRKHGACMRVRAIARSVAGLLALMVSTSVFAHGVAGGDASYLESIKGVQVFPLMYLGAKHMVTGYDHLLFLAGVIFFLYRLKDVALYVTLFAVGHSVTLLLGVLAGIHANAYIVDAIIGLSVVYKALENIGAFQRMGLKIDPRAAVLLFGLAH